MKSTGMAMHASQSSIGSTCQLVLVSQATETLIGMTLGEYWEGATSAGSKQLHQAAECICKRCKLFQGFVGHRVSGSISLLPKGLMYRSTTQLLTVYLCLCCRS